MGIEQKYGQQVPVAASFTDEHGKSASIADLLGERPIVVLPMFFACTGVCRLEVDALLKVLEKEHRVLGRSDRALELGKDYEVLFLGIHPKETHALAKAKEARSLEAYNLTDREKAVHSWVGTADQILSVTDALGFKYEFNELNGRINHPAAMIFLDKQGIVRGYMYGADYATDVFRKNVIAASRGDKGLKPEIILLGCVMVDPLTGQRTLVINRVLQLFGILTVLIVAGSILYMSRKYRVSPTGLGEAR